MDKKKLMMIVGGVVLVLAIGTGVFFLMQGNKPDSEKVWLTYVDELNNGKYNKMYAMLSKEARKDITKDDFVTRNSNIYSGMGASNIKTTIVKKESDDSGDVVTYKMSMSTAAGKLSFKHKVHLKSEDDTYRIDWDTTQILPDLGSSDKVNVSVYAASRGRILDRNDVVLAEQGSVMSVGVVPGILKESQDASIKALSEKIEVSEDTIHNALDAEWVQDDYFVPVKTIAYDESKKLELESINGVQVNITNDRIYPYGTITGHLTGYVQPVNADELKKLSKKGYDENSVIGKTGLEQIYEDSLRGEDGCTITILDSENNLIKSVLSKEKKDGEDVKTTIDINIQKLVYDQMVDDKGAGAAMNPLTGEVLALVSTPSYDPNQFVLGMDTKTWNSLNENENKPLLNRFTQTYAPGSTFKPITGAIALKHNAISASDDLGKEKNNKWQKDSSWGDHYVTTIASYGSPSNLKNALIYSDNIYFAKTALKIGKETFAKELDNLGFRETFPFDFTIKTSTYGEGKKIENEETLADSGYGQGDVLVSPLHMDTIYSSFVNDGSMVKPYLIYEEGKREIWKNDVFSSDITSEIYQDLVAVMHSNGGSTVSLDVAAKTGTAEVGEQQLGWICAVTKSGSQPLALSIIMEETQDKGGSHYVMPKVQSIYAALY